MIALILKEVATVCHLTPAAVLGRSRIPRFVRARELLVYVAINRYGLVQREIAEEIGLERTTIGHALRRAERRLKRRDAEFNRKLSVIQARLETTEQPEHIT